MSDARNERRASRAKAGTDLLISLAVVAAATVAAMFLAQPAKASDLPPVYLVTVVITLPGKDAPQVEVTRHLMTASSAAVCKTHAEALAERIRQLNAESVKRMGATVRGKCELQGAPA